MLLLPETADEEARALLLRLQLALETESQRGGWPVSFSIGAVTFSRAPNDVETVFHDADAVMYEVKESGKSAVKVRVCPGDLEPREERKVPGAVT
jgi:GGDEF domain-containing protein